MVESSNQKAAYRVGPPFFSKPFVKTIMCKGFSTIPFKGEGEGKTRRASRFPLPLAWMQANHHGTLYAYHYKEPSSRERALRDEPKQRMRKGLVLLSKLLKSPRRRVHVAAFTLSLTSTLLSRRHGPGNDIVRNTEILPQSFAN